MPAKFPYMSTIIFIISLLMINIDCDDEGTNYENLSPNVPSNPIPASGATDQPIDVQLSWECSDPDSNVLTYDIYFGTSSNPGLANSGLAEAIYQPVQLQYSTTYYWRIKAIDSYGAYRIGTIWNFTTLDQ